MKHFYLRRSLLLTYVCLCVAMAAAGIARYRAWHTFGPELGVGLVLLVVTIWSARVPIVSFERDHVRMKVAPAARTYLVPYEEIVRLESVGTKKLRLVVSRSGAEQVVTIPLTMLGKDDGKAVFQLLGNRAAA